jgi:Ni/Fe-hydrogenase subunit HybB-like protein
MNRRLSNTKTILWALVGILAVLTLARFMRGLGATTALTDAAPWGLWIAFDVMSGVALAAGGFVVAATVYIFGRQEYHRFARPAILTALLGYAAVAVGLLYDLGLPWHIWHPMVYPQHHSVLFEVAMCVMLYLTVLALEFAPVVLEHPWFDKPFFRTVHSWVKRLTIPLVISGIVLSTLHQSSLGSLFLLTPYRLHELWYSPIIWVLFFVSAIALGLMMVTAESFFSSWLFKHKLRLDLLAGLGRAASIVLFVFAALRIGDVAYRGLLPSLFNGSWQSNLFIFEVLLSALLPAALLLSRKVRTSGIGLGACAAMTIFGMIGYRFDVCIVAFMRPDTMPYFPSWIEVAVSMGIVAGAMLIFIFFIEKFRVCEHDEGEGTAAAAVFGRDFYNPSTMRLLSPARLDGPRRYTMAVLLAAAVTVALLPADALHGVQDTLTPVSPPRAVEGYAMARAGIPGTEFAVLQEDEAPPEGAALQALYTIDGNRNGRVSLFPHTFHVEKLGSNDSCVRCHHLNMPQDRNSACSECHRDMYAVTDIFDHGSHVEALRGNDGCADCHRDPQAAKDRSTALTCTGCHAGMVVAGSVVRPPEKGLDGFTPSYMDAMHGLCVTCHEQVVREGTVEVAAHFSNCATCHHDLKLPGPPMPERTLLAEARTGSADRPGEGGL